MRRSRSSNAATSAPADRADTSKPSGAWATESPWLIQTDWPVGSPRNNVESGAVTVSEVRPNSARPVRSTWPPSASAIAWNP